MNKKKSIVLSLIAVVGLMVITIGISYAFFNYAKAGTKENVLTTGTITFLYTEIDKVGAGINIEDALPMTDSEGKAQVGSGKVFNFKIEANTTSNTKIPYIITARMKDTSTLPKDSVKLYLTKISGTENFTNITGANGKLYDSLTQYDKVTDHDERIIYQDSIRANATNYLQEFNLRMWLNDSIDYSSGNYNGKSFTININVYSDATVYKGINSTMQSITDGYNSKLWAHRATVTKMVFQDEIREIPDTVYQYDISEDNNGSVMARLIVDPEDSTKHIAYIQGDGGIYAPTNSRLLLYGFKILENIEGLEYLDTSKVTSMSQMFQDCDSLTNLDLSSFKGESVTSTEYMFSSCDSLISVDMSNFIGEKVATASAMFYNCSNLTSVDLGNFSAARLNNSEYMFSILRNLTTLNLSRADFSNVISKRNMFYNSSTNITVTVLDATAEAFIRGALTGGTINIAG